MSRSTSSLSPASSSSRFPPTSSSKSVPSSRNEPLYLEDGETQADLPSLLSPDLSTSLRYLLAVLSSRPSNSKFALRVAIFLLNPPRPSTLASTSSSSSSKPVRTKPEATRAVVALLFGITSILSRSHAHEDDEKDLEKLSECLVGIFVKGGGKSKDLDEEVAVAVLGGSKAKEGSRSTWEVSRIVIQRLDSRIVKMQDSDDSVDEEQVRVRTRINSTYLLALLFSGSSSAAFKEPTSNSSPLSTSETLFARCIALGLSISLIGASPSTSSSSSLDPHSSHADSLVWKSRKRLELSGHASIAVVGLPSDGQYERWDGGAGERARLAEEKVRGKVAAGEEKSACRAGIRTSRLVDGSPVIYSDGGDLLDAPRRLKGKKVVAVRRGIFSRSTTASTVSTSGPNTPTEERDCPFPHHSHNSPTSLSSPLKSQPITSLPSLKAKPSIHLLHLTSSPPRSKSSLPRDHRKDPPPPSPEALKASTPIPLPNLLLEPTGIFSPTQASIGPPPSPIVEVESVFQRGSRLLQRSVSRLALAFPWNEPTSTSTPSSPTPIPPATFDSSQPSSPPASRPSSIRVASFGQSSVSSGSSTSSSPTSPIFISDIPKIAFQPSTFRYDCFEENQDRSSKGGVWAPSSPRGDRVRVLGGSKRGKRIV